jgi:hypothetical protein
MSAVPSSNGLEQPASLAMRIDKACDRFEADWKAGRNPRIEEYLPAAPEQERAEFLRELLTLEIELRTARAEQVTPEDYVRRFPNEIMSRRQLKVASSS